MFDVLMTFFKLFNTVAFLVLLICCGCAVLNNIKLNKLASAKIALPSFKDCVKAFRSSCISSSLFLLINWAFFSSSYVSEEGLVGKSILAEEILSVATGWAVLLAILIVLEIVLKFFKNNKADLKDALIPVTVRSVWCFVLAFIIA